MKSNLDVQSELKNSAEEISTLNNINHEISFSDYRNCDKKLNSFNINENT